MNVLLYSLVFLMGQTAEPAQSQLPANIQPQPISQPCESCASGDVACSVRKGAKSLCRLAWDWFGPMPQTCYQPRFGCYPGNARDIHRYPAFHGYYYRQPYNYRHYFEYPWHAQPHEPLGYFTYPQIGEGLLEKAAPIEAPPVPAGPPEGKPPTGVQSLSVPPQPLPTASFGWPWQAIKASPIRPY
ncbi:MAG: hypothetical protein NZ602_02420 [Thermoguttaceae bacterium]|nr:hypothetical protein [Thermoguttaceae bacterium]MDW8036410.1 hypothetical protein [Thermoguttaceae bacterium]